MAKVTAASSYDAESVYGDSPEPYPDLLINTRYPPKCRRRLADRTDSFITPIGRHFVRNHNAVPDIDPEEYTLTIEGEGVNETVFSLHDLKTKFEKVSVTTVIQCNGNRREDFHYIDGKTPAFGPPHWVAGAIGNVTWTGVRLRDLLEASGMDVDSISLRKTQAPPRATQVGLLGYDHDEVGNQYCCSFPFDKAVDPFRGRACRVRNEWRRHTPTLRLSCSMHCSRSCGCAKLQYLEKVTITDEPCKGNCNWKQYAVHASDVPLVGHKRKFEGTSQRVRKRSRGAGNARSEYDYAQVQVICCQPQSVAAKPFW